MTGHDTPSGSPTSHAIEIGQLAATTAVAHHLSSRHSTIITKPTRLDTAGIRSPVELWLEGSNVSHTVNVVAAQKGTAVELFGQNMTELSALRILSQHQNPPGCRANTLTMGDSADPLEELERAITRETAIAAAGEVINNLVIALSENSTEHVPVVDALISDFRLQFNDNLNLNHNNNDANRDNVRCVEIVDVLYQHIVSLRHVLAEQDERGCPDNGSSCEPIHDGEL